MLSPAILAISGAASIGLGGVVLANNPRPVQNRVFGLFSLIVATWSFLIGGIMIAADPALVEGLIRAASYTAVQILFSFYLLCLSIEKPGLSMRKLLREAWAMLALSQAAGLLSFTPFYLEHAYRVDIPGSTAVAEYGWAFPLYNLYFPAAFVWTLVRFVRAMRKSKGIQRHTFQFVLLGMAVSVSMGITTNVLIPQLTGSSATQPLGPLSALAMTAIVAYGIATKRILDVGHVLRRATAYLLLVAFLALLYAVGWFAARFAFPRNFYGVPFPHVIATLVVALAMAPTLGVSQGIANRLFLTLHAPDLERTLQEAHKVLYSVARLDDLLFQFGALIHRAFGADHVQIVLRGDAAFEVVYPVGHVAQMPSDDPLLAAMAHEEEPVSLDTLARLRYSPHREAVARRMNEIGVTVAVAVRHKGALRGGILLGPRGSGRIYTAAEQDTLQLLGNQLGVAIENAKLYTEVQDARIYNNILLDSLLTGVIATNRSGQITVFNREAARILCVSPAEAVGRTIDGLPAPLRTILTTTLETHDAVREQEHTVSIDHQALVLRVGSTALRGHENTVLGAQLVFSDITRLKALEQQVRHNERLVSIGTLSAGMAHEIKNPLVSIKTFTELLPTQYEDPEFRDRFSTLVGAEVQRIDRIVNQLLYFARPAKTNAQVLNLHDVLKHSVQLIEEDVRRRGITLEAEWRAERDLISGDADLLQQVFVNFFFNALEAMDGGGTLRVCSGNARHTRHLPRELIPSNAEDVIHVRIEDTGEGIAEKHLPFIFDPFFTTKSKGIGLGLAVAHRIISEHGATAKAERRDGGGTVFHLVFPLGRMEPAP